ncbi:UNVERIFIED_ORG: hypothetical protein J2W64_004889 [Rahnella aquatilis]|nr:hypothetical protein [Rahnella aquatilis]
MAADNHQVHKTTPAPVHFLVAYRKLLIRDGQPFLQSPRP